MSTFLKVFALCGPLVVGLSLYFTRVRESESDGRSVIYGRKRVP